MTFIGATKIKHIAADQIKTAFRFSFNATLTKQLYLTSSGAVLKQRHVKKQKEDTILVQFYNKNISTKRRFHKICLRKNRCGSWLNKQDGGMPTLSLRRLSFCFFFRVG